MLAFTPIATFACSFTPAAFRPRAIMDVLMNLDALRLQLRGDILTPASPEYDIARRLWNGMIDRRPAAIVRCTSSEDVAAAVRFAAREELYPAIRAGGHNVAGLASVDGGLVIDVSPMK